MLTDASYHYALYAYVGAALLALLMLGWWLSYRWRPGWVIVVVFVLAGVLLTPAYPNADAETLAPAVIVGLFQLFIYGYEDAEGAFQALATFSAAAFVLSLFIWLLFLRGRPSRRTRRQIRQQAGAAQAGGKAAA